MKTRTFALLSVIGPVLACTNGEPVNGGDDDDRRIEITEVMRIGGLEGEMEYTYTGVSTMTVAPDGRLFVVDRQGPVLREYNPHGEHVRDIGRSGQGPGEIQQVSSLAILESGELAVADIGNRRVSYFSSEGDFLRSLPVREQVFGWPGIMVTRDNRIFASVIPEDGVAESPDGIRTDFVELGEDGAFNRTSVPVANREGPNYVLAGRGGHYKPFTIENLSTIGPDGSTYSVRNDEYVIRRIYPSGDSALITRAEQRVSLTGEERDQWESISERFIERTPDRRDLFLPIPDQKPFIRNMLVDSDGRLWVSRYTPATYMAYSEEERLDREERGIPTTYNWRDEPRWDVFDSDNTYLGHVVLPFKTTLVDASGNRAWGVQSGDYREDFVIVWQLEL